MQACTIAARNYVAHARVLGCSLRNHHPDWSFTILMVDGVEGIDTSQPDFEFLSPADIGLEWGEFHQMAMIYDVTELSTALKPWLLRYLIKRGRGPIVYLDPDIEIFASLEEIARLARRHSMVLTPHLTAPLPRDNLELSEDTILGAGIYNLGFIAIGSGSEQFLDWWSCRLRRECLIDPPRHRFTDQRWIDLVPGLYRHYILRDETYNVAYWNVHARNVAWTGAQYEVNGRPLRFYHYSGYDFAKPHLLTRYQGENPRTLLSQKPGIARLCREYAKQLQAAGVEEMTQIPYRFASVSEGIRIDPFIRRSYYSALAQFESGCGTEPPHPFGLEGGTALLEWLNEPLRSSRPVITRYMLAVYNARLDLRHLFSEPLGSHAAPFREWIFNHGVQEGVQASLLGREAGWNLKDSSASNCSARRHDRPVTVAGYLTAELGVGEAARAVIAGLKATGVPVTPVITHATTSRRNHPFEIPNQVEDESDINIICVNADQIAHFLHSQTPSFRRNRFSIGFWFWELEDFPDVMHPAFDLVDEVWVSSDFTLRALLEVSPKPIHKFPLPIATPVADASLKRSDFSLPNGFIFLFSFDFLSVFERKNPIGVINAFRQAFAPGEGPSLVVKTINGDKKVLDMEKLHYAKGNRPDIIILDGYLSPLEKNTMTLLCDCYVSLHRSEGFGLTMAEAMALGKPVIATGYSGNLEFMTPENSFLCSYEHTEVGNGSDPYPATSRWAEPNMQEAAHFMRWVYQNPIEACARGVRAAQDVRALSSLEVRGTAMRERLHLIRRQRGTAWSNLPLEEFVNGALINAQ